MKSKRKEDNTLVTRTEEIRARVETELKLPQGVAFLTKLAGETLTCYCGEEAVTDCENCGTSLCAVHADFATYEDVDVCSDQQACANRIDEEEACD